MKVYCKECKYIRWGGEIATCNAPQNLGGPIHRKQRKATPYEINMDNNCGWYEGKKKWRLFGCQK